MLRRWMRYSSVEPEKRLRIETDERGFVLHDRQTGEEMTFVAANPDAVSAEALEEYAGR